MLPECRNPLFARGDPTRNKRYFAPAAMEVMRHAFLSRGRCILCRADFVHFREGLSPTGLSDAIARCTQPFWRPGLFIGSRTLLGSKKMTFKKLLSGLVLSSMFLMTAAAHAEARVFFVEPKDGATVTSPVHVVFGLEGMGLAPAGDLDPNKGHHHLLIDAGPMQKGLVIPANDKSLHFGKAQTEADVKLPPGDHTLTLQFGDGAHQSFGPEMSQTIKIHVK
jgi:hypothetical protein